MTDIRKPLHVLPDPARWTAHWAGSRVSCYYPSKRSRSTAKADDRGFRALLQGGPNRHPWIRDRSCRHVVDPYRQIDALPGPYHRRLGHRSIWRFEQRKINSAPVLRNANTIGSNYRGKHPIRKNLKIQAPTPYWHFKSKEELVDAMATLVLAKGAPSLVPLKNARDWKVWVNAFGMGLRQTYMETAEGHWKAPGRSRIFGATGCTAQHRLYIHHQLRD